MHNNTSKKIEERKKKKTMTMKASGSVRVAMAAAVAVLLVVVVVDGAVTCQEVDDDLRPCVGYVTGKEAAPPAECCAGVKRLRAMPVGTAERRAACECVKKAAARYEGLKSDNIRDLPGNCGSPLPFPLSLNFDCNSIP